MNFQKNITKKTVQRRVDGIITFSSIRREKAIFLPVQKSQSRLSRIPVKSGAKKISKKKIEAGLLYLFLRKKIKALRSDKIFLKRLVSICIILVIVLTTIMPNSKYARGATYTWSQGGWSGGETSNSAVHPGNQIGWDQFSAKDSFVEPKNVAGDDVVVVNSIAESSLQTSDNGLEDTHNMGGFNAGTRDKTKVRGAGTNARVGLAYNGVSAVSAGNSFMIAIKSDNTMWGWGKNTEGQLGDGTSNTRYTPTQIIGENETDVSDVEMVSAGEKHVLALKSDGTVLSWGNNDNGQLGDNTTDMKNKPVQVLGPDGVNPLVNIIAISAGNNYSLALKSDGTVWAWGKNDVGQLGNNSIIESWIPVQVVGVEAVGNLNFISNISAGYSHVLAIQSDGTVISWGKNDNGQLGNNTNADSNFPIKVVDGVGFLNDIVQVAAGNGHSLGLKADGTVWTWGENNNGQLGNNTSLPKKVPVRVVNSTGIGFLSNVSFIAAGNKYSLAVKDDGTAWAWGFNNNGQLGDNSATDRYRPIQVIDSSGSGYLSNVSAIDGGDGETIVFKSDTSGTVWNWGNNDMGQLGVNTINSSSIPVQTFDSASGNLANISQVDSGYAHTLALNNTDGTVWSWGLNGSGQLGNLANGNRLTPNKVLGPGGVGFLTGIKAVAAGSYHSLSLKDEGGGATSVWSWGYGDYGQLGNGSPWASTYTPVQVKDSTGAGFLSDVKSINAGESFSIALKNDGTVWTWGNNNKGQLGINNTDAKGLPVQVLGPGGVGFLTNVIKIAAGSNFALALRDNLDGTTSVWSWGQNNNGQLGNNTTTQELTPIQVMDQSGSAYLAQIIDIAAGSSHSIAIRDEGGGATSVWSWGLNDNGQLGDGTISDAYLPKQVLGLGGLGYLDNISQLAAGSAHTLALRNDGTVFSWGLNGNGQLGDDTNNNRRFPVQVLDSTGLGYLSSVSNISGGQASSVAVKSDNTMVWSWGINSYGELGNNKTSAEKIPVNVWGSASGNIVVGHSSFFTSGTFTSKVVDTGSFKTFTTLDYSLDTPTGTSLTIDIKAGNTPDIDGSWVSMSNVSNGQDITALGQKKYYQYVLNLTRDDINVTLTPSLDDIVFNYTYFPSGEIISSIFDSTDLSNVLSKISWTDSLNAGTNIKFQVRTAADNAGLPGAWSLWVGPDGTPDTYFSDKTGSEPMPSSVTDGIDDQWLQYKAFLNSDGLDFPTLSSVIVQYVVNAPPEVQNVVAAQGVDGVVTVDYEVRDPDTNSGTNTPGAVKVDLQYCSANCASLGNEIWANASTVSGNVGNGQSVDQTTWNSYQLTWNAKNDYAGIFNGANFKVRIKADDGEGANRYGYGLSGNFILDTKNPNNVGFSIDHTKNELVVNAPSDDSLYEVYVGNDAGSLYDLANKTSPLLDQTSVYPNHYAYNYLTTNLDPVTVYVGVKDAFGNTTTANETTPKIVKNSIVFYDISNKATNEYRELVSWQTPSAFEVGAGFAKYNIWRSEDNVNYALVNFITDKNVNYYLDSNLNPLKTYYYKVTVEDIRGNISEFSDIINDIPDGQGGVNSTPPEITNVKFPPETAVTTSSATFTWDTDKLSNSTVGCSETLGNYENEVGNATLVTINHNIVITGLVQDTKYYCQIKSVDFDTNMGIDDNGGDGYSFTTSPADVTPPDIADVISVPAKNSATMSWTTNENATSFVEYSAISGFSAGTSYGSYDLTLSHTVTLPSLLAPNTIYYYKIHSKDAAGNDAVSSEMNFQTTSLGDITAPIISAVQANGITHLSANINWKTDESSNSYVEYGTTVSYGKTFGSGVFVGSPFDHNISLPQDLTPDTVYHYRVHSTDPSGNESVSIDYNFKTLVDPQDITNPVLVSGPTIANITSTSAMVSWVTNEPSSSYVDYSPTSGVFQIEQGSAVLATSHSITLLNLDPNTGYFYQIKSADSSNNVMTDNNGGAGFTFSTSAGQPPVLIGAPFVTKDYKSAAITWATDINATSFVEYSTDSGFSNTSVVGKYDSVKNHSISLSNLVDDTAYYFRVRSSAQFELVSGPYSFITDIAPIGPDEIPPVVSNILPAENITDNGAIIKWDTAQEDTDSIVQVGATTNYQNIFGDNAVNKKTGHEVSITGLSPNTTYHYQIVSKDAAGNVTFVSDQTFTTLSLLGAPVITEVGNGDVITYNSAKITWKTDVISDSKVEYGLTSGKLTNSLYFDTDAKTDHSIDVNGLDANTTYYYKVISKGSNGLSASNSEQSFTTSIDPQFVHDPLKTISKIITTPYSKSASITFTTDQAAKCFLEYRVDGQVYPGAVAGESDFDVNHSMQILDLVSLTKYFYKITCEDNLNNVLLYPDEQSFITNQFDGTGGDKVAPKISNVKTGTVTGESIVITWDTDKKASSYVRYGLTTTLGTMVGDDKINFDQANYVTSHTVTVGSLIPATKYSYQVVSVDASGNIALGSVGTFATATQSALSSISIISTVLGEAAVSWLTNNGMTSSVEYGITNNYGQVKNSNSLTTKHEISITGLKLGEVYHFRVKSVDSDNVAYASGDYMFQPKSPPIISNISVKDIMENGATVTFLTNIPSDAVVAYSDINNPKNSGSQGQTSMSTGHEVVLKNLEPGVTYAIKVQAKDESGNASEQIGQDFTTGKDETAPEIDNIKTESALAQGDKVQSIISWVTNENATTTIFYREGKNGEKKELNMGDAYTTKHIVVMTVFKPGVVYFFTVRAVDEAGNVAFSSDYSLLTPKKKENIIQIIINNFQDIFHWVNV